MCEQPKFANDTPTCNMKGPHKGCGTKDNIAGGFFQQECFGNFTSSFKCFNFRFIASIQDYSSDDNKV